jgi:hypothetical protein
MNLAAQQLPSNNHFVVCGLKLALMTLAGKWVPMTSVLTDFLLFCCVTAQKGVYS